MSESDPTDDALAAIATILDRPDPPREAVVDGPAAPVKAVEADGYCKSGPGPIASIRLKWTVRREANGDCYVDETVGESSAPIVSGPMTGEAAVRMVDDREGEAQRQFAQLRSEMSGKALAANPARSEGGDEP